MIVKLDFVVVDLGLVAAFGVVHIERMDQV
jgi:hypothetical protein